MASSDALERLVLDALERLVLDAMGNVLPKGPGSKTPCTADLTLSASCSRSEKKLSVH